MNYPAVASMRTFAVALIFCLAAVSSVALGVEAFPMGTYDSQGYSVSFESSGHFHYTKGTLQLVDGVYTTKGDEITLTDQTGIDACKGAGKDTGRYRWVRKGELLTFTPIDDSCNDRIRGLANQDWKLRGDRKE